MKRLAFWLLPALALGFAAVLGVGAVAQRAAPAIDPGNLSQARSALRDAQAAARNAERRSALMQRQAEATRGAAERTAHEAAALAARVQLAEADIRAAEARLDLARREHASLREALGREQQPIVHLTGALQQVSRRPLALSVLQPGSVEELVHLRAVLAGAMPRIEERTSGLRVQLARARALREEAAKAAAELRTEQAGLAQRKRELAEVEATQRRALREAETGATRESERALALGEQSRDLDALVGELDRSAALRRRLAALPGPVLRASRDGAAAAAAVAPATEPTAEATTPPAPYLLPVTGRTVLGFGAREAGSAVPSQGLTLAPRPGAQIVSPGAGRVAFAGPYRGYGRIVIVEHAGGWTSLITGLERTDVVVGQQLVAGAPLGVAAAASPQVTVELRRDGEPVNPLRFAG
jgi:septal ring factor EnvC (AmiA/AmiB activator)